MVSKENRMDIIRPKIQSMPIKRKSTTIWAPESLRMLGKASMPLSLPMVKLVRANPIQLLAILRTKALFPWFARTFSRPKKANKANKSK